MLLWSEQHKKCAFEFTKKGTCKEKDHCAHCAQESQQIRSRNRSRPRYCFSELREKDSCRWKENCRFNHEIPEELRADQTAQTEHLNEKEIKAGKCVNEYREAKSCKKGKEACRFSHDISAADRANPEMQKQMKEKYENIINPESRKKIHTGNPVTSFKTIAAAKQLFDQFLSQFEVITANEP